MWAEDLLKLISEGKRISELRSSLQMSPSELRSAVKSLKALGIPLKRVGDFYTIESREVPEPKLRDSLDVLVASKEAVKTLRFVLGEDVYYLWPNKVLKGRDVILELRPEGVEHSLPPYLYSATLYRISRSLSRRKLPEVVRSLNALLYRGNVSVHTKRGGVYAGPLVNVDIRGRGKVGERKIAIEEVEDVSVLSA